MDGAQGYALDIESTTAPILHLGFYLIDNCETRSRGGELSIRFRSGTETGAPPSKSNHTIYERRCHRQRLLARGHRGVFRLLIYKGFLYRIFQVSFDFILSKKVNSLPPPNKNINSVKTYLV